MKKVVSLLLALIMMSALALAGCQKTEQAQTDSQSTTAAQQASATEITAKVSGNYGSSQQLTDEDLSAAVKVIQEEVGMWEGVSLANIRYAGDEVATKENLARMNELGNDKGYTQVCEFLKKEPPSGGSFVVFSRFSCVTLPRCSRGTHVHAGSFAFLSMILFGQFDDRSQGRVLQHFQIHIKPCIDITGK